MKNLFATLKANAAKRALYRRTRDEIARMRPALKRWIWDFPGRRRAHCTRAAVWG